MKAKEAADHLLDIAKMYFQNATVVFANQSRIAKPKLPLVTLRPGNVKRPHTPTYSVINGVQTGFYSSRMEITIDLFTHGSPLFSEERIVAYEDSSTDDLLSFVNFLDSTYVTNLCGNADLTILINGDAVNLTGIVNDTNYEYRSRISVFLYFTEEIIGHSSVLSEKSVRYPTGKIDPETGLEIYTTESPVSTTSTTGDYKDPAVLMEENAVIIPVFTPTHTGGGSEELANKETGYFEEFKLTQEDYSNE